MAGCVWVSLRGRACRCGERARVIDLYGKSWSLMVIASVRVRARVCVWVCECECECVCVWENVNVSVRERESFSIEKLQRNTQV